MAHAASSGVNPATGKSESYMYSVPSGRSDTCQGPNCGKGFMHPYAMSDDNRKVLVQCSKGCGYKDARQRMDKVQDLWHGV